MTPKQPRPASLRKIVEHNPRYSLWEALPFLLGLPSGDRHCIWLFSLPTTPYTAEKHLSIVYVNQESPEIFLSIYRKYVILTSKFRIESRFDSLDIWKGVKHLEGLWWKIDKLKVLGEVELGGTGFDLKSCEIDITSCRDGFLIPPQYLCNVPPN